MAIAHIDQHLYLHGSWSSRLYMALAAGERVCVSVYLWLLQVYLLLLVLKKSR